MVRISDFVDLWILEELAPGFGIHARPLYISDEALFDLDFGAREMTRMIRRAGDDAIGLWRRRSWVPFLLKCRVFDDGIGKPSCRLVGKHVQMPLLVYAARPPFRHIFGEIASQIGPFRICDLQTVGPRDRFNGPLLSQSPYSFRSLRNLSQYHTPVHIHPPGQRLVSIRTHVTPHSSCATRASENPSYVWVRFQHQLHSLADIFAVEFLGNRFQ